MPRLLRYVLDGLGTPDAQSADLMSYLLFDAAYTRTLVEIGYCDADARRDEIESFLADAGAFEHRRASGRRGPSPGPTPVWSRAAQGSAPRA
jgi:NTE family protein